MLKQKARRKIPEGKPLSLFEAICITVCVLSGDGDGEPIQPERGSTRRRRPLESNVGYEVKKYLPKFSS